MPTRIREIMTPDPIIMQASDTATEAARVMRDEGIGNVIVYKDKQLCGIVTDRDLTVRLLSERQHPAEATLESVCSREITALSPNDTTDAAVRLMRKKALRRLLVVEDGKVVGIVSLGDLAVHLDRKSALADISAAAANR
jgi:signal-transduction protein with cAMP-binding, CBS, and nucleotidyltransferase domain